MQPDLQCGQSPGESCSAQVVAARLTDRQMLSIAAVTPAGVRDVSNGFCGCRWRPQADSVAAHKVQTISL